MGNEVVCPTGQSWYLDELDTLKLKIHKPLFDGTFMISFLVSDSLDTLKVVKIVQLHNALAHEKACATCERFRHNAMIRQDCLAGNVFPRPHVTRTGAYMIRDYFDFSLAERIEGYPPLAPVEKQWITFQLLRAVSCLHANEMVHGDIKPENVFVTARGFLRLSDHAPFKPLVIHRNQPHHFIHFFSYGKRSAFLAPERIVIDTVVPQPSYDSFAADLFSVGAVIAYLYSDGDAIFDFSSLMQYADGDDTPLKKLADIKDPIVALVTNLLARDPPRRVTALQSMQQYFPDWCGPFCDFGMNFPVDEQSRDVIIGNHDLIFPLFPTSATDDLLIYSTVIGQALLTELTITLQFKLLDFYRDVTFRLADSTLKITRVLTLLMTIIEKNVTIVNIRVFQCILDLFETIPALPRELDAVGEAYLLPRLLDSVQRNPNWQYHVVSQLPFIIASFSRLWPTLLNVLPHTPPLFTLMLTRQANPEPHKIALVEAFLRNAADISGVAPYPIFVSISYIVVQLMNIISFVPMISDFFTVALPRLAHADFVIFHAQFFTTIQRALVTVVESRQCLATLFLFFESLIQQKVFVPCHLSALASVAFESVASADFTLCYSARRFLRAAPRFYRMLAEGVATCRTSFFPAQDARPRLPAPIGIRMRAAAPSPIQTCLASSIKLANAPIRRIAIVSQTTTIAWHAPATLAELRFCRKAALGLEVTNVVACKDGIVDVDRAEDNCFMVTHRERINVFHTAGFDVAASAALPFTAVASRFLPESGHFTVADDGAVHEWSLMGTREITAYVIRDIAQLHAWPHSSLFSAVTRNGTMIFFDNRVPLPVAARFVGRGVVECIPLSGQRCALRNSGGFAFYDALGDWQPVFTVVGGAQFAMARGAAIMACDPTGTFYCAPEEACVALFDGSRGKYLPRTPGKVVLPIEHGRLLHGHIFPVVAGDCSAKWCVTGDTAGFVNLWSPVLSHAA
jgi:serine/threonine protein kinase